MSSLSQRLHLGVQQRQILTPGLVQMVTVLQLSRMELKDMIINEIAENPVLEEAADATDELTPEEVQSLLERERQADPADQSILDSAGKLDSQQFESGGDSDGSYDGAAAEVSGEAIPATVGVDEPVKADTDPFEEIDFGSFFDDYLDPGFKTPASESIEKPAIRILPAFSHYSQ